MTMGRVNISTVGPLNSIITLLQKVSELQTHYTLF